MLCAQPHACHAQLRRDSKTKTHLVKTSHFNKEFSASSDFQSNVLHLRLVFFSLT